MSNPVEELIYSMLTENTGRALCDSGGAYGRNWESNQTKTLEDFQKEPSATLEIWDAEDFSPTVSVFHKLTSGILELDALCETFNAMKVSDWDSEKFYGVSGDGEEWLEEQGFTVTNHPFNTYNWDNSFSQVLQGSFLELDETNYVLLQIHGGCDVRGGYTDAKLFRISSNFEEYDLFRDDCMFSVGKGDDFISLDWFGEWINKDGETPSKEDFKEFAEAVNATKDGTTTITGELYNG